MLDHLVLMEARVAFFDRNASRTTVGPSFPDGRRSSEQEAGSQLEDDNAFGNEAQVILPQRGHIAWACFPGGYLSSAYQMI